MSVYVGLDIGSRSAKGLILRDDDSMEWVIADTEPEMELTGRRLLENVLERAGTSRGEVSGVVATGYGRVVVSFAISVTEITCHARGAVWLDRDVRLILDMGGQDSKAIRCNSEGKVTGFALNEKCAAGTGRYLERVAQAVGVPLDEMGRLSLQAAQPVQISSVCAVFAQNEVVGFLRDGKSVGDILAGACRATVRRQLTLLRRVGLGGKLMFCGGVARNIGVVKVLEEQLGGEVFIPPEPQIVGALGAALIARERAGRGQPAAGTLVRGADSSDT